MMSATETAGVHRRFKGVLKIYLIRSVIEPQIGISIFTPMKIKFKRQPLPDYFLWLVPVV